MALQSKNSAFYIGYVIFHFLLPDLRNISAVHQDLERILKRLAGPHGELLRVDPGEFFGMISRVGAEVPPLIKNIEDKERFFGKIT
ncbi:hypothetical protein [Methanoculleus sp.]|uniref:hypothetical protein n=1 Tax=Methanoculleus sp. TaxID=90427 RepID=UPI002BC748DD|nr:hypothetical protein [Methanoculleus sp.]HNT08481.1 hypothetical protein [Methanoculleus sp.]